jgi:hypothetical protein
MISQNGLLITRRDDRNQVPGIKPKFEIQFPTLFLHRLRQLRQVKRKIYYMHQKRKYRGAAWLVFFISSAALAFAIISHWPWLTLIIPFVTTSFVWAMDIV